MSASFRSQNSALSGLLDKHLTNLAEEEQLAPESIVEAIEAGTMVLLGNPAPALTHQGERQHRHFAPVQLPCYGRTQNQGRP